MAYTDEFRELIEDTLDAIRALCNKSEPDSWMRLRVGFVELCNALERDDRAGQGSDGRSSSGDDYLAAKAAWRDSNADYFAAKAAWGHTSRPARESLVLQVLADDRLTVSEMADRMNAELGFEKARAVHDSNLRPMLSRMLDAGQLERQPQVFRGKVRYRYFRKRGLEGPIADLERAYYAEAEED